jgi:cytochrome c nitrite reductase small subunit
MIKIIKFFIPPKSWRLPAMLVSGALVGIIMYAFYASNAVSYLSDDPKTCVNCHIMAPEYATWQHSSHREVANCNDCHVPHNNVFNKYFFKAKDGMRHAAIFTVRGESQTIFIKEEGRDVVQNNCIRCHNKLITNFKLLVQTNNYHEHFKGRLCWDCHREVPHGRVNSLSSVPNARVPLPSSPVPDWLKEFTEEN